MAQQTPSAGGSSAPWPSSLQLCSADSHGHLKTCIATEKKMPITPTKTRLAVTSPTLGSEEHLKVLETPAAVRHSAALPHAAMHN